MSGGISATAVASAVATSVAGAIVTSALTKKSAPQQQQAAAPAPAPVAPLPEVEEVATMPTANDAERKAAARRSVAQQKSRQGRASTVLTDDPDAKLGG